MSKVDLGFIENCLPWQVESRLFPSKMGGKPAWLNLENLPSPQDLLCVKCNNPLIFFLQVYAPYEEDVNNFHRTIFVFICRNSDCCTRNNNENIKVFRSSLPRKNKFYSFDPPLEEPDDSFTLLKFVQLCQLCGCLADKHCGQCKKVTYCSREHQVHDWKEKHKTDCKLPDNNAIKSFANISKHLFPEKIITIEEEELVESQIDETLELERFKDLEAKGQLGTMQNVPESDFKSHINLEEDKVYDKFRDRISESPQQIMRYDRGGTPLWIAEDPIPQDIPNCEYCGQERQFEFQIMPQLLALIGENNIDYGVLAIYTCRSSCTDGQSYKKEFVFKQDVSIKNIF